MKPLSLVVVSFLAAVILLLPVCRTQEPPYTVQTIESSLKHMKNVWESLYTNFLNNNDSVACSDALENLPGCLEIELDGEGRTFLASAEGERAYLENINRLASICSSHQLFQNASILSSANISTAALTFTDALGTYQHSFLPDSDGFSEDTFCSSFDPLIFDPRRDKVYIQSTSSPKLVTILNLVGQSGPNTLQAIRSIQYAISYTLDPEHDYVVLLTQETVPCLHTISTDYSEYILEATLDNVIELNSSLERSLRNNDSSGDGVTINYKSLIDLEYNETASADVDFELKGSGEVVSSRESWLNLTGLFQLLTPHKSGLIPCSSILLLFIEEDIDTSLAEILMSAYNVNPDLQIFIFNVRPETMNDEEVFLHVNALLCKVKGIFESSNVDKDGIINGRNSIQSYLAYLGSSAAIHELVPISWYSDHINTSQLTTCIRVYNGVQYTSLRGKVFTGVLCLEISKDERDTIPRAKDDNSTCENVSEVADLTGYDSLRHFYRSSSTYLPNCLNNTNIDRGSSTQTITPTSDSTQTVTPTSDYTLTATPITDSIRNLTLIVAAKDFINRVEGVTFKLRKEIEFAYRNASLSEQCFYGDCHYNACLTDQPFMLQHDSKYGCQISWNNTLIEAYFNDSINSFIHKRSLTPEIFYSLCASGVMDHLARSDASNFTSLFQEPTVLWGYYSNVPSNFIRYFPYSDCRINKTREGCFDVQFRPWYITATSEPKTTYLIIHVTQSENFEWMQEIANVFLNTLTERDLAAVHLNNITSGSLKSANSTTRQILKEFIESQEFAIYQKELNKTFSEVFQEFERVYNDSKTCHQIILFLSDSSLYQELPGQINQLQPVMSRVDIFTYTVSSENLPVDSQIPQEIACSTGGDWFEIGTGMNYRPDKDSILMYLEFYPHTVRINNVIWSEIAIDTLSQRDVYSACLPVYNPDNTTAMSMLIGVTCINVDAERFNEDFNITQELLMEMTKDQQDSKCSLDWSPPNRRQCESATPSTPSDPGPGPFVTTQHQTDTPHTDAPPSTSTTPTDVPPTRRRRIGVGLGITLVVMGILLLCFSVSMLYLSVASFQKLRKKPRNKGYTEQDDGFDVDYQKLHENLTKDKNEEP